MSRMSVIKFILFQFKNLYLYEVKDYIIYLKFF